ncbi:MAG TPA: formylglycine-generating enzyme family protein [bacterium]|nr:formylglycine-generating enzyme family protein [bacterium]
MSDIFYFIIRGKIYFIYFFIVLIILNASSLYAFEIRSCIKAGDTYSISWEPVLNATKYMLEEDTAQNFLNASNIYSGTDTIKYFPGKAYGKYYYRVKSFIGANLNEISNNIIIYIEPVFIDFVSIPAGTFTMGGNTPASASPSRSVTLTTPFQMSKYEITNEQYAAFLNAYKQSTVKSGQYAGQIMIYSHSDWGVVQNGSQWVPAAGKEKFPAINVTWYGANEFADYYGLKLPTEAQWEYACRANTTTMFYWGESWEPINDYEWYQSNSNSVPHQVGQKKPNAFGLYDMTGNIKEWCADWYGTYSNLSETNPIGPANGSDRVLRSGAFNDSYYSFQTTCRSWRPPSYKANSFGFRVVK